jgi:peptidoglycan/LPS O-acetylase OafA/YrhL
MESSPQDFRLCYFKALDGLRGIAILGVMIYHAGSITGGYIGVDVFFTLSGFLITSLLIQEQRTEQKIDLLSFYKRRALRLLPALWFLVLVSGIYEKFYRACPVTMPFSERAYYALTYYSNWVWALGTTVGNPLCSFYALWSLAIEEQFYFVWPPILACFLHWRLSMRSIALILCVLLAASIGIRTYLWTTGAPIWRMAAGTDTRADPILIGCLSAIATFSLPLNFWKAMGQLLWICAPMALLTLIFLMARMSPSPQPVYAVTITTCIGLLTALVIFGTTIYQVPFLTIVLGSSTLGYIGKISYGLYLWHSTVGAYVDAHFPKAPFILELCLVMIFTLGSYYFIELPFLRLKNRRTA